MIDRSEEAAGRLNHPESRMTPAQSLHIETISYTMPHLPAPLRYHQIIHMLQSNCLGWTVGISRLSSGFTKGCKTASPYVTPGETHTQLPIQGVSSIEQLISVLRRQDQGEEAASYS